MSPPKNCEADISKVDSESNTCSQQSEGFARSLASAKTTQYAYFRLMVQRLARTNMCRGDVPFVVLGAFLDDVKQSSSTWKLKFIRSQSIDDGKTHTYHQNWFFASCSLHDTCFIHYDRHTGS